MAPGSKSAPQQYSQPSRKGKKAWRKNVDVSEIEEGLEDVRDQIIQGGVIAEKSSEELFKLDTLGDQKIKKAYGKVHKPLKIDEILNKRSAIPTVGTHKRGKVSDGIIATSNKRWKSNFVSRQELEKLRRRAHGGSMADKDIIESSKNASYDPWAITQTVKDERLSFLEEEQPIRAPPTLGEPPISLLADRRQLPSVTKPKGALSYNPVFQDWDNALMTEGEKETEAERKRLEETKAEQERQTIIEAAQNESDDVLTEDESAWEGFESEYENAEHQRSRQPGRKTPAQRNKVKRKKKAESEAKHNEAMRKRGQREVSYKSTQQRPNESGANGSIVRDGSDEDVDDRLLRRRRFGKDRLPDKDLELVLPDELQDSLRLLKPEGNLLKDRFRNLQVQGKLETRKPISQPKKKRRTVTEKWSYKDFRIAAR